MKHQQTLINGQQQDQISVLDRAVQYGDGVFETIAINQGQALAWDRHISRLQEGCRRLDIKCPESTLLKDEVSSVIENCQLAVLKLIISRGVGGRAYEPPGDAQTTRILSLHDWPDYPKEFHRQGIEAGICESRLGVNPLLAGIKHLNRLEQVILKMELSTSGLPEAIVRDIDDNVIEGTTSNLFLVKDGRLFTAAINRAGVCGVIRAAIIELAPSVNIHCQIMDLSLDDVLEADEVFFCNSIAGIWSVNHIRNTRYTKRSVTKQFQKLLISRNLIVNHSLVLKDK